MPSGSTLNPQLTRPSLPSSKTNLGKEKVVRFEKLCVSEGESPSSHAAQEPREFRVKAMNGKV